MDWSTIALIATSVTAVVAIIAVVNQIATARSRTQSQAREEQLSIREHNEFKDAVRRENDIISKYEKELREIILDRVKVLEQTRPTTGELKAEIKATEPVPRKEG